MNMAKKDNDDPDRVRPPQRGNDERITGQEKKSKVVNFKFLKVWKFGSYLFENFLKLCQKKNMSLRTFLNK